MTQSERAGQENWYSRPVVFVSSVDRALTHYQGMLGCDLNWDHQEDNEIIVAQVSRGEGCEIILCKDEPRAGKSRVFVALDANEVATLRDEIKSKNIPAVEAWWGTEIINISDPDGNEMFFSFD